MECKFLKVGNHEPCHLKPVKDSQYCSIHKTRMKKNQIKPCLKCGKGTYAKYQICFHCGAHKIRLKHRYIDIMRPYQQEAARLRHINL